MWLGFIYSAIKCIRGILPCGHNYHVRCFIQANERCSYCYKFLCDGIKNYCKLFQNTLSKEFSDDVKDDDENLENQKGLRPGRQW